jgi:PKD repeat protein
MKTTWPFLFVLLLLAVPGAQAQFEYTTNNGTITITQYTGPGGAVSIPSQTNNLPVTSIAGFAFYGTSVTSVTIPDSVTSIQEEAFESCYSLASVTIPASVTNLGAGAFSVCFRLSAITVSSNNPVYLSIGGVVFNQSQTTLVEYPDGEAATSYTIPSSVTNIGGEAFWDSYLTNVTIPDSVTSIEEGAFGGCNGLANITIPNSVTSIGDDAFFNCLGLTNIMIPDSVTSIGDEAFQYCLILTNATIAEGVTSIGDDAFNTSALTNVTIPDSVNSIGVDPFGACPSLTAITVGAQNSFYSSSNGVLFDKSQTTLIQFPGGLSGSYTMPASVTNIGDGAFDTCTNLASVTIPGGVASIGDEAFIDCTSLTGAYFEGNAPTGDSTVFSSDTNATVYYLSGTSGWGPTFGGVPTLELTAIAITGTPTNGLVPLRVSFTSAAVDTAGHAIANWNWNFGDGSTSAAQNPSHTYTTSGTVLVTLIETNNNGVPIAGAAASITVSPLTVSFTANPTNGLIPLTVSFSSAGVDSSGNTITSWNWNFGDGSTSIAQNPSHTYTLAGNFSPSLLATNNAGVQVLGLGPSIATELNSGLVLNGDFETGDFTGWTMSGDTSDTFVDNGSVITPPYSETYAAALGESTLGYLSQTLSTTAGASYLLSFWFENPYQDPGEFLVSWNGNTLLDIMNPDANNWTNMQFMVSATGTNTILQFGFQDDTDWLALDDISVLPAQAQPGIASLSVSDVNLVLNGTNGQSGGTYYVLTSTSLSLPLSQWTPVATNVLSAGGNFTIIATNTVSPSVPQRFYILQTQ